MPKGGECSVGLLFTVETVDCFDALSWTGKPIGLDPVSDH